MVTVCPTIFDDYVLAFNKTKLLQALMECGDQVRRFLRSPAAHEPHYGCARLLGVHGSRPCNHTPNQCDEHPALHAINPTEDEPRRAQYHFSEDAAPMHCCIANARRGRGLFRVNYCRSHPAYAISNPCPQYLKFHRRSTATMALRATKRLVQRSKAD